MKNINYFVAYRCGQNYGRAAVAASKPIMGIGDIQNIETYLKEKNIGIGMPEEVATGLIVIGWQRFEPAEKKLITN